MNYLTDQTTWTAQQRLAGHLSPVTSIAIAPSSGAVFTAGYDGHVLRWDATLQSPSWAIRFPDLVNSVAVSPDSGRVAVACADGFAYVLDSASGFELSRLGPHADDVNDVAWNPTRPELAIVCDAGEADISIWNLAASTPTRVRVVGHEHGVFSVAYSPDGERYASASEDGTVRVWRDGVQVGTLPHEGDVETVAWSSDDIFVATGCDDGVLRLWDATSLELAHELTDSPASVRRVAFSPDGSRILAGCYDGVLRVYDTRSGALVFEKVGPLQWERAAVFTQENDVLVGSFGSTPTRLVEHAVDEGLAAPARESLTWGINALCATEVGVYFATDCGFVGSIADSSLIRVAKTLICGLAPTRGDGLQVRVSDYLGRVKAITTGGAIAEEWLVAGGPTNTLVELPDGTVVVGSYDGTLSRLSANGSLVESVNAHHGPVKRVVWSEALDALVVGSSDDTVSAWAVHPRLACIHRLESDSLVLVNDLHPLNGSAGVALASRDRAVRIWWPDTQRIVTLPTIHSKSVKAISGSVDDRLVVTGSYDGSLCFWNLRADGELDSYRQVMHHGKPGVPSVVVHGSKVFSGGWNGTIAEWNHAGDLMAVHDPKGWQR